MNCHLLASAIDLNNEGVALATTSQSSSPLNQQQQQQQQDGRGPGAARDAIYCFRKSIQLLRAALVSIHDERPSIQQQQGPPQTGLPQSAASASSSSAGGAAGSLDPLNFSTMMRHARADDDGSAETEPCQSQSQAAAFIPLQNVQSFTCVDCAVLIPANWTASIQALHQDGSREDCHAMLMACCAVVMINIGILSHRLSGWKGLPRKQRNGHARQALCMYENAIKCLRNDGGVGPAAAGGADLSSSSSPPTTTTTTAATSWVTGNQATFEDSRWGLLLVATNNLAVLSLAQRDVEVGTHRFGSLRRLLFARRSAHPTNESMLNSTRELLPPNIMQGVLLNSLLSRDVTQFMSAAAAA